MRSGWLHQTNLLVVLGSRLHNASDLGVGDARSGSESRGIGHGCILTEKADGKNLR